MKQVTLSTSDKLLALLEHKYNLHHADKLYELLFDENVDVNKFMSQVRAIELCESSDIDECENIPTLVHNLAIGNLRNCYDYTIPYISASGYILPSKHNEIITAFYYDMDNEELVVVGYNNTYPMWELTQEDLIYVYNAMVASFSDDE